MRGAVTKFCTVTVSFLAGIIVVYRCVGYWNDHDSILLCSGAPCEEALAEGAEFVESHFCSFRDLYPRSYISYKTTDPPTIDGVLDEDAWQEVGWSEPFVDILGSSGPVPRFQTRMKMRWDDEFLYIAGALQEPDVWANVTQHDAVIFQDNDFEA
jgi:hypothetical protein